jgi:hypothetical protein
MHVIFERRWEQIFTPLKKRRQQEHGVLDIGHRISA